MIQSSVVRAKIDVYSSDTATVSKRISNVIDVGKCIRERMMSVCQAT